MIVDILNENIFTTDCRHIAFAVNRQGFNDSGFAKQVSVHVPSFKKMGNCALGEVYSKDVHGKVFHALVCHSLSKRGWNKTPEIIIDCLGKVKTKGKESIAIVLIGAGIAGDFIGANVIANLRAIHKSSKKCILYTLSYNKLELEKYFE